MPREDADHFIENSLIKMPLENFSRVSKTEQKSVAKELELVTSTLEDLKNSKPDHSTAVAEITRLVGRFQGLKRKLEAFDEETDKNLEKAANRLGELSRTNEPTTTSCTEDNDGSASTRSPAYESEWERKRLDRIIAEHLAREGLWDTAAGLVEQSQLQDHVDIDIFLESRPVIEALKKGNCGPALKWCSNNKPRLKKIKSNLEFSLRLQEFVELVRAEQLEDAISHARKHFAPAANAVNLPSIRRYMGLLAFRKDTTVEPYKSLFEKERWQDLIKQFKSDECQLSAMPPQSLLTLTVQAGLTCLKSTHCEEEPSEDSHCPVCNPLLGQIASTLPFAHHAQSSLVCSITGAVMNEDNAPLVLPNGYVYSSHAMLEMANSNMVTGSLASSSLFPRPSGLALEQQAKPKLYILQPFALLPGQNRVSSDQGGVQFRRAAEGLHFVITIPICSPNFLQETTAPNCCYEAVAQDGMVVRGWWFTFT